MPSIDRAFLLNALAWLMIGTIFGFWMGASDQLQYISVHVAMMLPGFVTLAIYGFIYRLWPELKRQGLAAAQFWLAVLAQPLLVLGSLWMVLDGSIGLVAAASAGVIVAAGLLGWMFLTGAARS